MEILLCSSGLQHSDRHKIMSMTRKLSWNVQTIVEVWWPVTELQQTEVSIELELPAKRR